MSGDRAGHGSVARLGAVAVLCAAALGGCSSTSRDPVRLTVLATSDFHGAFDAGPADAATGSVLGGAARLAAVIARERARDPRGTVLVDAGDLVHGSALSNLTQGRTSVDLFDLLAPDAVVVGNHELDWGVEVLRLRMAEASFPFLLANVVERATGAPPDWARPHRVVVRRGVRIALIGVATETFAEETLARHVEAYRFTDPVAAATAWVEALVPERADLAIVVCHCGLSEGDLFGTEVKELAAALPAAAVIVAGHTHERHALHLAGVPVVQPGAYGRHVGRVEIAFDRRARRVVESTVELLPVDPTVAPDPVAARRIADLRADLETILAEELGTAAHDLDVDPNGECRLGNLMTDRIRERFDADMAFQNALGIRAPIAAGTVRFGDVYQALPFDNTVVLMDLSGEQIEHMLSASDAVNRILYPSGLRYALDLSRPAGERVEIVTKLQHERTYRVAVNEYMAQGGENLSFLEGIDRTDTGVLLRDVLADHLRERARSGAAIEAALDGRIEIRPRAND